MDNNKTIKCNQCANECPIDQVLCPRGEAYAAKLRQEEEAAARREEGGPGFRTMPHRPGEGGFRTQPWRPQEGSGPRPLPHRPPMGPGRGPWGAIPPRPPMDPGFGGSRGEVPPRPPMEPGFCGPKGGLRFQPPEDDGSLTTLMMRCAHYLRHSGGEADSQTRVLRLLEQRHGISQRVLQEWLGVQPGSLSELVNKLEDKGLLVRQRDVTDKRRVTLFLTEAGMAAAHRVPDPGERDARFSALTEEERETLRALLNKLLPKREAPKDEMWSI